MSIDLTYKKKIEEYFDRHEKEMLEDIKTLCKVNSEKMAYEEGMPFGQGPATALNLFLGMAQRYGFVIQNYDNYAGSADLNDKKRILDILVHLDVVGAGEGWTITNPFEPVIKDGKIYGRGTSDDKGPAVAALYAMRAVKQLKLPVRGNVRIVAGTDEESGSECIKHYYATEKEATYTFSPDGEFPVVNIEKGRLPGHFSGEFKNNSGTARIVSIDAGTKINVVPPKGQAVIEGIEVDQVTKEMEKISAQTGVGFEIDLEPVFMIRALGENAHASTPETGRNALTALLKLLSVLPFDQSDSINAVRSLCRLMPHADTQGKAMGINAEDKKSGKLTLAFSMLHMDEKGFEGSFDIRYPLCTDPKELVSKCSSIFKKEQMVFDGSGICPGHFVNEDSEFIKILLGCYEAYSNQKGKCISMGGGTYVHDIKNGVAFGAVMPGTDTHMHGPDEFAVIEQIKTAGKIFAQVITEI